MRKITKEAIDKFLSKEPFKKSNMQVEDAGAGYWKLKLHGNTIASIDEFNMLSISNAGWSSNTTKERLNGLPHVRINQKNWNWFLNGQEWNGEWTRIGIV
jgi:hypothetical protein